MAKRNRPTALAEHAALGAFLRGVREKSGLTQAELAGKLRQPQSYVSRLESGERQLQVLELFELCDAFGLEPWQVVKDFYTR